MNKIIKTEKIYADLRVVFERTTFDAVEGQYSTFEPIAVNSIDNNLTASERDYVTEQIMESVNQAEVLNALLDGLSGKSTTL